MAWAHAHELKPYHCTAVAVTPGWLRSELMLDIYGVTEANSRDACAKQPPFVISESPRYVGRAMAHLAADPDVARWNGQSLSNGQLAKKYDFADLDGSQITLWAIPNKQYLASVGIKNHAQEWDLSTRRNKSTPRAFVNLGAAANIAYGLAHAPIMIVNMSKARQK